MIASTDICSFIDAKQLIALMPGNVYWLDKENVYQGCNNRQALSFGLRSSSDIIGKRNQDLPILDPEVAKIWDKNNLEVMNSAVEKVIEEPAILENGMRVIVLSHKIPLFDEEGHVIGVLGTSLDISDWKKRENYLKKKIEEIDLSLEHIVSHLPGHVYWKNKYGIYLGCNDRQANTLGLNQGNEIIGKTDFDLPWGNTLATAIRENDLRIMSTENSEIVEEIALINNKETVFLSQKTPLKNKQGKVMGILGISFDITKQKELEKSLTIAKELAESADQLKSEFIRNMEHDIRTPFSGILGMAKILDANETDPMKKQIIRDISLCTQELLNYSCSILDFSNIEAGSLRLLAKKFCIQDLIETVTNIEKPAAKSKGLDFSVHLDLNVPTIIIGDEYRLKRILINLISNAIKFTHEGFVYLHISAVFHEPSNTISLKCIVEDSGIGIAEDKINMLYEKFSRLNPSNPGIYKGQGLGLRIVKQFVKEMKGEIEINSALEKGSSFTCILPFQIDVF
jgi:two-component system aerobic respiration control sensor histidine kinase ArcB